LGSKAKTSQRDKRVSSPISKPWVPGNNGFATSATNEIRIDSAIKLLAIASTDFDTPELLNQLYDRLVPSRDRSIRG
jgi:hypothetical protein